MSASAVSAEVGTSHKWPSGKEEEGSWLERSKQRARKDKRSLDYAVRSGLAGGIAGCAAKTAVAPLDRVKILFQTSNTDFKQYSGTFRGLGLAINRIWITDGVRGLFQGHSATLLRVFPYAGIKFMLYDRVHNFLMPSKAQETAPLLFAAGSISGVASVFFTYPLELIRVRLAFQTKSSERTTLPQIIKQIYHEADAPLKPTLATSPASNLTQIPPSLPQSAISQTMKLPFAPFYRGFTITVVGMVPYAGVSFLTFNRLKNLLPTEMVQKNRTKVDLVCGAAAGLVSQTASYPFEVVRRRIQVGGVKRPRGMVGWRETVISIYKASGLKGFYVGLGIGFIKIVPMTSISFTTWQLMKRLSGLNDIQ